MADAVSCSSSYKAGADNTVSLIRVCVTKEANFEISGDGPFIIFKWKSKLGFHPSLSVPYAVAASRVNEASRRFVVSNDNARAELAIPGVLVL